MLAVLHVRRWTMGEPVLSLVHGFTQTSASWDPVVDELQLLTRPEQSWSVVAPDLPGHGGTPSQHDGADLWATADLLADAVGPAIWVGYSLGARTLLHLLLRRPEVIEGLVLVGAKGGMSDAKREARVASDEMLARRIETDLAGSVDDWLAQPFNQRLSEAAQGRAMRLAQRPEGLAASLRATGSGVQQRLWAALAGLSEPVPTWVVCGEEDLPNVTVDATRLASIVPGASFLRMGDCGHAGPFERPEQFAELIADFVAHVRSGSAPNTGKV